MREAESYGILTENGIVKPRSNKIRGLTHLIMNLGDYTEPQVTMIIICIEVIICMVCFLIIGYI